MDVNATDNLRKIMRLPDHPIHKWMTRLTLERREKAHPLNILVNLLEDVSRQNLTRILGTFAFQIHKNLVEIEIEMTFVHIKEIQGVLGVDLDNRFTFNIHIENICKKICSGIGVIRRIKPFVPMCSLTRLYKALIQPYFDYCCPLWDTCGKVLKDKLQVLQNRATRVTTEARFDTNSADVLESLQWTTLDVMRERPKSVFL